MQRPPGFWRWYGVPVLIALGLFVGLNGLFNSPTFADAIHNYYFLYTAIVLMGGGALSSLVLLRRSSAAGLISRDDLGLGPAGWTAPRRLAALTAIAAFCWFGWTVLLPPPAIAPGEPAIPAPTWGDLCFWFTFLLSASLAEVLVFIGMSFCLLERGLRSLGVGRFGATATAALFSSAAFGLYHFTHVPRFHSLVIPLMGEMLLMLIFFRLTRNLYLTFVLHNLTAAVGFTSNQFTVDPGDLAADAAPVGMATNILSFVIPFVLLHALEWWAWPRARPTAADDFPGRETEGVEKNP